MFLCVGFACVWVVCLGFLSKCGERGKYETTILSKVILVGKLPFGLYSSISNE